MTRKCYKCKKVNGRYFLSLEDANNFYGDVCLCKKCAEKTIKIINLTVNNETIN